MEQFIVRQANEADFTALETLEKSIWGKFGTDVFDHRFFSVWRKIHPEGFLVSELGDQLIAYIYFQRTDFPLENDPPIPPYLEETDNALTIKTHRQQGRNAHVVSICSSQPGGGRSLMRQLEKILQTRKMRFAYGGVRIPGFRHFLEKTLNLTIPNLATETISSLAKSYIVQTAKICGQSIGPKLQTIKEPSEPKLLKPDPSLGALMKASPITKLLDLLPNYMPDPFSLNYAALIGYENQQA